MTSIHSPKTNFSRDSRRSETSWSCRKRLGILGRCNAGNGRQHPPVSVLGADRRGAVGCAMEECACCRSRLLQPGRRPSAVQEEDPIESQFRPTDRRDDLMSDRVPLFRDARWLHSAALTGPPPRLAAGPGAGPRPLPAPRATPPYLCQRYLSRNAPLLSVQQQGGWRSAAVLLRVYARWIPQDFESVLAQQAAATQAQPARRAGELDVDHPEPFSSPSGGPELPEVGGPPQNPRDFSGPASAERGTAGHPPQPWRNQTPTGGTSGQDHQKGGEAAGRAHGDEAGAGDRGADRQQPPLAPALARRPAGI